MMALFPSNVSWNGTHNSRFVQAELLYSGGGPHCIYLRGRMEGTHGGFGELKVRVWKSSAPLVSHGYFHSNCWDYTFFWINSQIIVSKAIITQNLVVLIRTLSVWVLFRLTLSRLGGWLRSEGLLVHNCILTLLWSRRPGPKPISLLSLYFLEKLQELNTL